MPEPVYVASPVSERVYHAPYLADFIFLCGRRRRFRQGHFLPDVLLKLHNTVTQLRGPLKFPLSTGTRTFPSGKAMVS